MARPSRVARGVSRAGGSALPAGREGSAFRAIENERERRALRYMGRPECEIAATDQEIDNLVYELYGITDEESIIIEGTQGAEGSAGRER